MRSRMPCNSKFQVPSSFADLIVDDGQVMLPFRHAEPLVLQLDDSDVRLAVAAQREGVVR